MLLEEILISTVWMENWGIFNKKKKSDFELAIIRLGINNSELYATEMHLMLVIGLPRFVD